MSAGVDRGCSGRILPEPLHQRIETLLERQQVAVDDVIQAPRRMTALDIGQTDELRILLGPAAKSMNEPLQTGLVVDALRIERGVYRRRRNRHTRIHGSAPQIRFRAEAHVEQVVADPQSLRQGAQGRPVITALGESSKCQIENALLRYGVGRVGARPPAPARAGSDLRLYRPPRFSYPGMGRAGRLGRIEEF